MSLLKFCQNPENISQDFSRYIKSLLQILLWLIIGLASLAAAFIAVSCLWQAVKFIIKAIGF